MKTSFVRVLELFRGQLCINIRYLLLLFIVQGICGKKLRASDALFYRQKIAAGKTTWCVEHNVLTEQTELSFPGSHEHKTPGAHVSCPFTYFERKGPLPWPVKQWSPWTSVHRLCDSYLGLLLWTSMVNTADRHLWGIFFSRYHSELIRSTHVRFFFLKMQPLDGLRGP